MTASGGSHGEHPSTYFVQNRKSEDELARLMIQDQMLTDGMGGVLPELPDPGTLRKVLDVGCGPGGWLIKTAKEYPAIVRLVGADVSSTMIAAAREQAEAQSVANRVEFHVMDALRMLEFPAKTFDLINQRLGSSYLRTWDWPGLLSEFQRVSRTGGIVRLTEGDIMVESTSPALTRLLSLSLETFYRAGHFFEPRGDGIAGELPRLLKQSGFLDVQTSIHSLHYRAGTPQGEAYYKDMMHAFRTALPFYRKWVRVPDDYEAIYRQALGEMQEPDFTAIWRVHTAWGVTPLRQEKRSRTGPD